MKQQVFYGSGFSFLVCGSLVPRPPGQVGFLVVSGSPNRRLVDRIRRVEEEGVGDKERKGKESQGGAVHETLIFWAGEGAGGALMARTCARRVNYPAVLQVLLHPPTYLHPPKNIQPPAPVPPPAVLGLMVRNGSQKPGSRGGTSDGLRRRCGESREGALGAASARGFRSGSWQGTWLKFPCLQGTVWGRAGGNGKPLTEGHSGKELASPFLNLCPQRSGLGALRARLPSWRQG